MQIDQPKAVRRGEELDTKLLRPYLAQLNPAWDAAIEVRQFPAGSSNLTYLLQIGEQAIVLRRPPFGANIKGGHDMHREYRVQKDLAGVFSKVPKVYAYCADTSLIGSTFYLMERVEGLIVRQREMNEALAADFSKITKAWLDTMVELHQADFRTAGLGDLGHPEGYNERQVKGWTKRYLHAKTEDISHSEKVINWLNERIPRESAHGLVHNDYRIDNVIFEPGNWNNILAVLDWEMATLGDPMMDLGTSLAYWVEPGERPILPTNVPQDYFPGRLELLHSYLDRAGTKPADFLFYYVFGLFKIAVIVQQIFYRYHLGATKDVRFANFNQVAALIFMKANLAIEKNRIDRLE